MRFIKFILFAITVSIPFLSVSGKQVPEAESTSIFKNVAEKLRSLKTISYHYSREFNYPSEGYINKSEGEMYIDFDRQNDLAGFRYQYKDDQGFSIFNNTEIFDALSSQMTIATRKLVNQTQLEGKSALYNSLVTMRNALPSIIGNAGIAKSVKDTTISGKTCYELEFLLHDRLINFLGTGFSMVNQKRTFRYLLIADKNTLLPLTLLQLEANSKDLNRTDFTNINLHPAQPAESSWFYSSYLDQYKPEGSKMPVALIKAGAIAPPWTLSNCKTGTKETLAQYKGNVILLEFWMRNCGHCIEAVQGLNALHDKYEKSNLKLLAINTEDSRKNIDVFIAKNAVRYTVLYGNDLAVTSAYGIESFPQIVLIDKVGQVLYSGEFKRDLISNIIKGNI